MESRPIQERRRHALVRVISDDLVYVKQERKPSHRKESARVSRIGAKYDRKYIGTGALHRNRRLASDYIRTLPIARQ